MVSSAVSSVLYLRDTAAEHAEIRLVSCIYYGDVEIFREREFRTRFRCAGKTGDHHLKAVSEVCDGFRRDAFVAAQEVGYHFCCEFVEGFLRNIDTQ